MRSWILASVLLLGGCTCVDENVLNGLTVARDNTEALAKNYGELLDRSEAPAATGPETPEETAAREKKWLKHIAHQKALMSANTTLANKNLEWAEAKAPKKE